MAGKSVVRFGGLQAGRVKQKLCKWLYSFCKPVAVKLDDLVFFAARCSMTRDRELELKAEAEEAVVLGKNLLDNREEIAEKIQENIEEAVNETVSEVVSEAEEIVQLHRGEAAVLRDAIDELWGHFIAGNDRGMRDVFGELGKPVHLLSRHENIENGEEHGTA